MKHLVPPEKPSQSILVGCLLAASGGLQDAYTYNVRDQVFANAQTGNMVLVGQSLALGQWAVAVEHLIPVLAFAGGVFVPGGFFAPSAQFAGQRSGELCVRHAGGELPED